MGNLWGVQSKGHHRDVESIASDLLCVLKKRAEVYLEPQSGSRCSRVCSPRGEPET